MKKYWWIVVVFFVFNVMSLINVLLLMGHVVQLENVLAFIILALIISVMFVIAIIKEYWLFLRGIMTFNILAVLYMLYVVVNRSATEWSDLVSIISFLLVMGIGVFISAGLEFWQRKKQNAS